PHHPSFPTRRSSDLANAMSLATENVRVSEVLFAAAVMTFGTFVAPSASGEAVRELVFVWLLGTKAGAAKAFLIGNLGFWIEKIPDRKSTRLNSSHVS